MNDVVILERPEEAIITKPNYPQLGQQEEAVFFPFLASIFLAFFS
jgi:hypothetical protein